MKKRIRKSKTLKTRNSGTMTEAAFWGMIRATLRNKTRFWKPKIEALKAARRKSLSTNKRLKWEFQCNNCKHWFPQKFIQVHHSQEAGSLKSASDLPIFVERLFSETGWECLCKNCHKKEHERRE